jgi:Fe-S cluster assembly protein SufB
VELSTYFRINDRESGQFERTLIIAEDDSYVSYLEGCTAPAYDRNQLHAAVVELVAHNRAHIKYSTVQNWYPGDPQTGAGGIFNFVTKRGRCKGFRSKICWTQVEVGAAITWKYPSCLLQGDESVGEFYSIALTNGHMQADTGTKMIHTGKNTTSTIISKGISADRSHNCYRGLVKIAPHAEGARNFTNCDSMLVGDKCSAVTLPFIDSMQPRSKVEHEATTSKISEEQLFYLQTRGLSHEDAINLIVNGFCKEVVSKLPFEFAQEAKKLLTMKLEHSVG